MRNFKPFIIAMLCLLSLSGCSALGKIFGNRDLDFPVLVDQEAAAKAFQNVRIQRRSFDYNRTCDNNDPNLTDSQKEYECSIMKDSFYKARDACFIDAGGMIQSHEYVYTYADMDKYDLCIENNLYRYSFSNGSISYYPTDAIVKYFANGKKTPSYFFVKKRTMKTVAE